jgi:hypothetical protein
MSLGPLWERLAPQITRTLGETGAHPGRGERVILRRPGSLEAVDEDVTPSQMQIAVAAAAGTSVLVLRFPPGGPTGRIKGSLPVGARLTLGATTYTTSAAATAVSGATTLTLQITPALVAPAAENDPVTLQPDALFTLENCQVSRKMRRDLSRDLHADAMAVVTVPTLGAPVTPRLNDSLELEDGTVGRVAAVPITTGCFWKLQMGGQA